MPDSSADDLVIISRFGSLPEAEGARSALEAAGIEAFLADENTVGVNWLYSNALGGMRLYVSSDDAAEAARVLGFDETSPDDGLPAEEDPTAAAEIEPAELGCGECGSTNVAAIRRGTIALLVFVLSASVTFVSGLVAIPLLFAAIVIAILLFGPSHRCRDCGTTFVARRSNTVDRDATSPAEEESETPDVKCPHCGSVETESIQRRRLKGATLVMSFFLVFLWLPLLVVWPFLPKHRCLACEKKF